MTATYNHQCINCGNDVVNGTCTSLDCPLSRTGDPLGDVDPNRPYEVVWVRLDTYKAVIPASAVAALGYEPPATGAALEDVHDTAWLGETRDGYFARLETDLDPCVTSRPMVEMRPVDADTALAPKPSRRREPPEGFKRFPMVVTPDGRLLNPASCSVVSVDVFEQREFEAAMGRGDRLDDTLAVYEARPLNVRRPR